MARPKADMRRKIILPSVYSNRELCQLEKDRPWIFKSWAGTLSASDDHGRFAWNPWRLAGLIWTRNEERQNSYEEDLNQLVKVGLVHRYGPNNEFACFPKFEEHNSMTRPTPSEYPDPFPEKSPSSLDSPTQKPKTEYEVEVEGNQKESLTNHGLTTDKSIPPEVSQERKPKTPLEILTAQFFKALGQPKEFQNSAAEWETEMSGLLNHTSQDDLSAMIKFALEEDDFILGYLNKAAEPMACFVKNFDSIQKSWETEKKVSAARAKKAAKAKSETSTKTAPGSHGNKTGMAL